MSPEEAPYDLQAAIDGVTAELGKARLQIHIERQKLVTAQARIAELEGQTAHSA